MKRVLLLILLVMLAAWFARRHEVHFQDRLRTSPHDVVSRSIPELRHETQRAAFETRREARQAVREARREIDEARREVREALAEAGQEIQLALQEVRGELGETVEGLPVPIVPGTRVDTAVPQAPTPPDLPGRSLAEAPPVPPVPPAPPGAAPKRKLAKRTQPAAKPEPAETRVITGLISATEDRARAEAREELDKQVTDWLEPRGVPRSWRPSSRQVDALITNTEIEPVVKDYGTLYVARLTVDVSPERRAGFVKAYQRQLVNRRMMLLGSGLAFCLTCLAVLSGYIRADEATKGYYTNRLRLLAAAGVGATGAAIYHMIV